MFTDTVAGTSYSTSLVVGDLTSLLGGSTAYVGFSGASGGAYAVQTIANFSFVSIPLQTLQLTGNNGVVISWPGTIQGYGLQANANLATTNWVNVTNSVSLSNGQYQVTVPRPAG